MKNVVLGAMVLAALAVSVPAVAADLPVKAPVYKAPAAAPIYDWTGFYVGLNGGYSWGTSDTDLALAGATFAFPPFSTSQKLDGWVFGGQAGYNWQFNRNWVFGFEADLDATGQKGTTLLPAVTVGPLCPNFEGAIICATNTATGTFEQKLRWLGTARARLGFLPADSWMLYLTGGLAVGEVETNETISNTVVFTTVNGGPFGPPTTTTGAASANTTRAGWTVGGGAEWVIAGPWTAKLEYLHVDLGRFGNTFVGTAPLPTVATSSHVTDDIVRVGVNYRFGGPVVAKY